MNQLCNQNNAIYFDNFVRIRSQAVIGRDFWYDFGCRPSNFNRQLFSKKKFLILSKLYRSVIGYSLLVLINWKHCPPFVSWDRIMRQKIHSIELMISPNLALCLIYYLRFYRSSVFSVICFEKGGNEETACLLLIYSSKKSDCKWNYTLAVLCPIVGMSKSILDLNCIMDIVLLEFLSKLNDETNILTIALILELSFNMPV